MTSIGGAESDAQLSDRQASLVVTNSESKPRMSTAQAATTRQVTKIKKLMKNKDNMPLVKIELSCFQEHLQSFTRAFDQYIKTLSTQAACQSAVAKFEAQMRVFGDFNTLVRRWVLDEELAIEDELCSASAVSAKTKSSKRSSKYSSASSKRSSKSNASSKVLKVQAAMTTAGLAAEKAELEKSLEIESELKRKQQEAQEAAQRAQLEAQKAAQRAQLEAQKAEDDARRHQMLSSLNIRLARAAAEEAVLNSCVDESVVSVRPAPSTKLPKPKQTFNEKLPEPVPAAVHLDATDGQGVEMVRMMTAMRLPQLTPATFDGDPKCYLTFVSAFDSQIALKTTSDADRLFYLNSFLKGDAKELVAGCLYMDASEGYDEARRLLEQEFGDPHKISQSFISRLITWPPIKCDDAGGVKRLAVFMRQCLNARAKISCLSALDYTTNLQEVVQKLPNFLQNKWRERINDGEVRQEATFAKLTKFVERAAKSMNDPEFGKDAMSRQPKQSKPATMTTSSKTSFLTTGSVTPKKTDKKPISCLYCLKEYHDIDDCYQFNALTMKEKRKFLMDKQLCFGCFEPGHISKGCVQKRKCNICSKLHPTSMHIEGFDLTVPKTLATEPSPTSSKHQTSTDCSADLEKTHAGACVTPTSKDCEATLHQIIPVRVRQRGNDIWVTTYAFYDNGSSGCFVTDCLKDELHASSYDVTLDLTTMHGRNLVKTTVVPELEVTDLEGQNPVVVHKSYTREVIPVDKSHIPTPEVLDRIDYLREISHRVRPLMQDTHIGLLIGASCPAAIQPQQVIPTKNDGPYGVRLLHGWTVNGTIRIEDDSSERPLANCNCTQLVETATVKEAIVPDPEIRSVRKVLNSTLRECDRLDDEVCRTVFCEAESIVNSRPITTTSDDPNDFTALTPNHILTMKSKVLVPPPGNFQRSDVYMRKRWRRVQHLANVFWLRWKKEFLATLQTRRKWTENRRNLSVGDVVIVQDDSATRNDWPLGRVTETMKDSHGDVRSCVVKTASTSLHRPINKLVLLVPVDG